MNAKFSTRFLLCCIVPLTHLAAAQTWQTVDDILPSGSGGYGAVQSMGRDPFGNLYAAGAAADSTGNLSAMIRKSTDGGTSWSMVDLFPNGNVAANLDAYDFEYNGFTADGAGTLFAVGDDYWNGNWFVRKSSDGGLSWQTVDLLSGRAAAVASDSAGRVYVCGSSSGWAVRKSGDAGRSWGLVDTGVPRPSAANGVLCHSTAGVFVVGYGTVTSGSGKKTITQQYWYVRRSLDQGLTWSTVDAYLGGNAKAISADTAGNICVAGENNNHWIVRKSTNGGSSWATIDDFVPPCVTVSTHPLKTQCFRASPTSVTSDSRGNVFVAGFTETNDGVQWVDQWMVRMTPAGSSAWQTMETFQYVPGLSSIARGVTGDTVGNVFVGGTGSDGNGSHWLVRKLPAP